MARAIKALQQHIDMLEESLVARMELEELHAFLTRGEARVNSARSLDELCRGPSPARVINMMVGLERTKIGSTSSDLEIVESILESKSSRNILGFLAEAHMDMFELVQEREAAAEAKAKRKEAREAKKRARSPHSGQE